MSNNPTPSVPIQSTAGAISIKNKKGELLTQKVKVARYVTGKRPDYAPESSGESEEDDLGFVPDKAAVGIIDGDGEEENENQIEDRRLRRLQARREESSDSEDDRVARHRRDIVEPEILEKSDDEADARRRDEDSDDDEELDEEEIEHRRQLLRQRARQRKVEEEVLALEDEKLEGSDDEESSEYDEYTDSEDETGPRLKPVFVRKKDRVTINEREKEEEKQRIQEMEAKRSAEERRTHTLRLVEDFKKQQEQVKDIEDGLAAIDTGDENDEEEYELWKLRELKRMKRDRDERDAIEKEKLEVDKLRNMTEEERRNELRSNPKEVTNKAAKGKYKFLQKYYHRGAFFMNEEDTVYKQDFSSPTLEDHFDKTILPKVMQVKNFGRSGRTKYTHLVDQDTTSFESPWVADNAMNIKFHNTKGGGMKQDFDRPSEKKKQ